MPYSYSRDEKLCPVSRPWAVTNASTGALVPGGCHPTKEEALKHQRALTVNVPDARNPLGVRSGVGGN